MPSGKGTYGTKAGRPPKKKPAMTKKQKTLPTALKRKIMKPKSSGSGGY